MRSILIAIVPLVTAGVAVAADMPAPVPYKAPPPIPVLYNWTGLYLGVNVGGGWANSKSDFSVAGSPVFASVNNSLSGVIGGGQLGYNWQTGQIVYGIEADFQGSGMKGGIDAPCPPLVCVGLAANYSEKLPWFGTARGRLGYTSDGWLIYATGGYTYARVETSATASAPGIAASISRTENRNGWNVGGGIEVALSRNWTAKAEYLYIDLGSVNGSWALTGLPVLNDSTRIYSNIVRAGLNYRF